MKSQAMTFVTMYTQSQKCYPTSTGITEKKTKTKKNHTLLGTTEDAQIF